VVCKIKFGKDEISEEVHDHYTHKKSDLHTQFFRTTVFKNSSRNVGIKLFNKLPEAI
jgi:hypothetical protein